MTTICVTPQRLAELGLNPQQIACISEHAIQTTDPYKHQKKYIQKKSKADAEFVKERNAHCREYCRERYHNDPEYRQRKQELRRARLLKGK